MGNLTIVGYCVGCGGHTTATCDACYKPFCRRRHKTAHVCSLFQLYSPPLAKLAPR